MNAKKLFKKHGATALLIIGCGGVIGTAVAAVFGKEKYDGLIEETKKEKKEHKKSDKIKVAAKAYAITAVSAAISIGCLIASHKINANAMATVSAALAAKTVDAKKFAEKTKEIVGEKKYNEIEEKLVEDKMNANPPMTVITGVGEQLFYDSWNDRYFLSDMETVRKGVNDAVAELQNSHQLSMNEFFEFISPRLSNTDAGDIFGWDTMSCDRVEVSYFAKLVNEGPYKGKSAIAIKFCSGYEPTTNINMMK